MLGAKVSLDARIVQPLQRWCSSLSTLFFRQGHRFPLISVREIGLPQQGCPRVSTTRLNCPDSFRLPPGAPGLTDRSIPRRPL